MVVAWTLVPLIFWPLWLWMTQLRPLRHLATLHYGLYFFSIYAGAYPLYAGDGSRHPIFMITVMAYPFLALAGMVMVAALTDGRFPVFAGRVPREPASRREHLVVVGVTAGLFAVLVAYLLVLGRRIPLLVLLTDGQDAGQVARYVATKGYNEGIGRIGPLVWLSRILVDYFGLFLLVYEYGRVRLRQSTYGRLFALAALLTVITVAFNERYPIVKLVLYFVILIVFSFAWPRITRRTFLVGTAMLVALMPALAVVHITVTHGPQALLNISTPIRTLYYEGWTLFVDRGIRGQVTGLYYIFDIVPRYFDFFGGQTFSNPRGLLPYDAVVLPYLVCDWHMASPPGVQCSEPTAFFGEIYANFGLAAALASMMLMGGVLQAAHRSVSDAIDLTGSPYYLALFAFTAIYLADFAIGFTPVYFDARMYLIVGMFLAPRLRWSRGGAVPRVQAAN